MGRVETEAAAVALVDARAEREKQLALEAHASQGALESLDDERRDHFDIKVPWAGSRRRPRPWRWSTRVLSGRSSWRSKRASQGGARFARRRAARPFRHQECHGRVETEAAAVALVDARAEREKQLALDELRREALESLDDERRDHFDIKSAMGRVETEAAAVALVDARAEREKQLALEGELRARARRSFRHQGGHGRVDSLARERAVGARTDFAGRRSFARSRRPWARSRRPRPWRWSTRVLSGRSSWRSKASFAGRRSIRSTTSGATISTSRGHGSGRDGGRGRGAG